MKSFWGTLFSGVQKPLKRDAFGFFFGGAIDIDPGATGVLCSTESTGRFSFFLEIIVTRGRDTLNAIEVPDSRLES